MLRRFWIFSFLILISATAQSATVISRDNARHEGTIVEDNVDGVKLKVKMGSLEALVTVPRADILEIQNTPARVNPIDAQAKEILNDAEFAMQAKNLKAAGAAWAKLGVLYQSEPGYSAKAKEAFDNALALDPENALAIARPRPSLSVITTPGNDADTAFDSASARSTLTPKVQLVKASAEILAADGDRRRDHAVREMLTTQLKTTPLCTPAFDTPYPAQSGSYLNSNNCNDDYRPYRHSANCSPYRFAIFPYAVHVPGVTVTSSNPTYVVGCQPRYYLPATQQNCTAHTANFTPAYSQPQTATPAAARPAATSRTTETLTPSAPSNSCTPSNRPPATTSTLSFTHSDARARR